MGKVFQAIDGYKTYITLALGVVIVWVGHFWGPLDFGTIHIDQVATDVAWKLTWEALAGLFLRHGIKKAEVSPAV